MAERKKGTVGDGAPEGGAQGRGGRGKTSSEAAPANDTKTRRTSAVRSAQGKSAAGEGAGGGARPGTRAAGSAAESANNGDGGMPVKEPTKGGRGGSARAPGRSSQPDLKKDLRDFASGRPEGWNHEDWISFLESLQSRGHDIRDRDAIGMALEKERLDLALSGVKGVGSQKRHALIERYGTLWNLRNAEVDEIAQSGGVSRSIAERIKSELA